MFILRVNYCVSLTLQYDEDHVAWKEDGRSPVDLFWEPECRIHDVRFEREEVVCRRREARVIR